jgi:hypothetical protein
MLVCFNSLFTLVDFDDNSAIVLVSSLKMLSLSFSNCCIK